MTAQLEFFATDDAVAVLEADLLAATGLDHLPALVAVAWQMRQRDTTRALVLADEAEAGLASDGLPDIQQAHLSERLQLIRGEAKWLFGELDAGKALAECALQGFGRLGDMTDQGPDAALGCADSHWLLAAIAHDQGDGARRDAEHEAMAAAAANIDPVRSAVARAALARFAAFGDVGAAKAQWGALLAHEPALLHPAAACWVEDFWGLAGGLSSDHVQAIRHWSKAYTLALASGQARRAMTVASNVGDCFNRLNDHHAALEWMQRTLELARPNGWPGMLGLTLIRTADTLRGLRRLDAAAEMLREALALLAPLSASHIYAIALNYLGDVELDSQHYASAIESFRRLEQRAVALGTADLLCEARRGQAKALVELGQPEPALQAAQAALAAATSDAHRQIAALRVLADIHARHALAPPPGMRAASAPLHYLHQALDAAATIENYTVPGDLLAAMAREYAKIGDTGKAYELSLQANQAREKIYSSETSNRASAVQVSHETEKARVEAEHHRQLAKAHAERADTLELANATLEQLGAVGRDITGNLDAAAIFAALDNHVHALLDVTAFLIYRLEADGQTLKMVFGVEADQALPAHALRLDDPERRDARCARERQEIIENIAPGQGNAIAGTLETLSLMFAPLLVGDRLLGAMTIQSVRPHAYREREVAIFRTLSAYGAIALANDERTRELRETNKELERLSVTDRLTGLFNRLRLDRVLIEEIHLAQRYASCFSIVLLDIDHFKSVNDSYGHPVGDQVLTEVARLLQQGTREVDVLGRWGGEEFLIICHDTHYDGAMATAEKLRTLIASHCFTVVGAKTASFGVTSVHTNDTIQAMMARADAALYRSKANGRNRVEGQA